MKKRPILGRKQIVTGKWAKCRKIQESGHPFPGVGWIVGSPDAV